jgi:hypothetical protein
MATMVQFKTSIAIATFTLIFTTSSVSVRADAFEPGKPSAKKEECQTSDIPSHKSLKEHGYSNNPKISLLGRKAFLDHNGHVKIRASTVLEKDHDFSSFFLSDFEPEKLESTEITTEEQFNRLVRGSGMVVSEDLAAKLSTKAKREDHNRSEDSYYFITLTIPHESLGIGDQVVNNCVFDQRSDVDIYQDGFISSTTDGWKINALVSVNNKFSKSRTYAGVEASVQKFLKRLLNIKGDGGFDSESTQKKYIKIVNIQVQGETLSLVSREELENPDKLRKLLKNIKPRTISYEFKPYCQIVDDPAIYKSDKCRVVNVNY